MCVEIFWSVCVWKLSAHSAYILGSSSSLALAMMGILGLHLLNNFSKTGSFTDKDLAIFSLEMTSPSESLELSLIDNDDEELDDCERLKLAKFSTCGFNWVCSWPFNNLNFGMINS